MSTQTQLEECRLCSDYMLFPDAYVVHLSGMCCRCAEAVPEFPCGCCQEQGECEECAALNQSVIVRQVSAGCYVHKFEPTDFAAKKIPCNAGEVSLKLTKHEQGEQTWYSACVVLSGAGGERMASWYCPRLTDCCNIGPLRRHTGTRHCWWPKAIWVNGAPTPDFVPPQPEWLHGNPDDLNDAEYWPALDMPLMQDSTEVGVRFFNGELQLRTKDLGSDGFGVPWGHTRIYSNRLSNAFDFGNGYNWLILEWPQLVRRKTDPEEIKRLHPTVDFKKVQATGCTLALLRGTRNALWFDEFKTKEPCVREWKPRFGAKHTLEFIAGQGLFRLTAPNGHRWEFHAFTPNCFETNKRELYQNRDARLDGKFVRHLSPSGHAITATYRDGKLQKVERSGEGATEQFQYEYYQDGDNRGRLRHVTWIRGGNLRRAEYTYYEKSEPYGNLGDLKTARTHVWTQDGWKQRENSIHHFRYRVQPVDTYCQGLLQIVIGPEAFHRMKADGKDPLTASSHEVRDYADLYITYYEDPDPFLARRVKTITLFGGGRKHTFTYDQQINERPTLPPASPGYNVWHTTTTESRADGTQKTVASNFMGQTRRLDLSAENGNWTHFFGYDEKTASLVEKYDPSSVSDSGPHDSTTAAPSFYGGRGKLHEFGYHSVAGNRAFLNRVAVREGSAGASTALKAFEYAAVDPKYGVYAISKETSFGVGFNPGGMQDSVIEFQYSWSGLGHMTHRKIILPQVVPLHFPNAASYDPGTTRRWTSEEFDAYGNAIRITDLRNTTTVHEMDAAKGVPKREITKYRDRDGKLQTLDISYKSDDVGHVTQVLGPLHQAVVPGGNADQPVRAATWYIYKMLSGEVWTAQGYQSAGEDYLINPVQIQRYDRANRVTDSIAAVRTAPGRPTPEETLPQKSWVRWVHQEYNVQRTKVTNRVYHKIPAATGGGEAAGSPGTNYHETVTESDIANRRRTVTVAGGTFYETQFEGRGLPAKLQTGTSPSQMSPLVELEYDDGTGHGNGNVTKIQRWDGKNLRITSLAYDFRDRQDSVTEADGGRVDYEYNNQNTVSKMTRSRASWKLAKRAQRIDVRGRVYWSQLNGYKLDGTELNPLNELTLYDDASQVIAMEPHGRVGVTPVASTWNGSRPLLAYRYDGLGRETVRRVVAVNSGKESTFTEIETYRNEVGDPILLTTRGRFPDSELIGFPGAGPLGDHPGAGAPGLLGLTPAHVSHVGTWYDPLGRRVATADFGAVLPPSGQIRPPAIPDPNVESVVRHEYDPTGELASVLDPLQHPTRFGYDHAGRLACRAANLTEAQFQTVRDGLVGPSGLFALPDDATISQYSYTAENKLTRTIFHNTHTKAQMTDVLYGAAGAGPADPLPPTAHLPREVMDAEGRRLKYEYNVLGEIVRTTDENGTVHQYEYDQGAKITTDRVIQCDPAKVDGWVRRIEYTYDGFGRLDGVASFDAPYGGKIVNYVIRKYGSYNELIVEAQLHNQKESLTGARTGDMTRFHGDAELVPDSSLDSVPGHVAYYYDYPSIDRNVQRLRTIWYPGDKGQHRQGRWLTVEFANQIGETVGRISAIAENKTPLVQLQETVLGPVIATRPAKYDYWAERSVYGIDLLNTRVVPAKQDGVRALSNLSLAGSAPFSSTDKLGRERRRQWQRRKVSKFTLLTSVSSLVDAEFGYDLNDNLRSRKDRLGINDDDALWYDRLDRLVRHDRGRWNAAGTGMFPLVLVQNWRRDQSGNWRRFQRQANPPAGAKLDQFRRHSRTDHIRDLVTGGAPAWTDPQYDAVGNMTRMPQPDNPSSNYLARYDAWNRLTDLSDASGRRFRYEYDGLGRRIVQRSWTGLFGEVRHFYYDQAGRVITEGVEPAGQTVLDREYIWDVNSAQRLICRIRHNPSGQPPGTEERLYALHDVLGNVVALVDTAGDVKERYLYDPQGSITYLNPNFTDKAQQQSAFAWEYLFAGMRRENASGLYFTGGGYYHVALGRILPSGPISVLPESQLNAYAQDFPFGDWRPPVPLGTNPMEPLLKWAGEQAPWIKFTVGAVAMGVTVISVGALIVINPYNPYPYFMALGALCGGIQGGIEASLAGGDFGDVMLSAGLGAGFGAIAPWGGIGALVGSVAGVGVAHGVNACTGKQTLDIATAYQWGGLAGGLAGDFAGAARAAIKFGARRALQAGLVQVGPDLLGAGAGAIIGYHVDGTSTGALHGATLGMMAGGLGGSAARGLWGVGRARSTSVDTSRRIVGAGYSPPGQAGVGKVNTIGWPWEWPTTWRIIGHAKTRGYDVHLYGAAAGISRRGSVEIFVHPFAKPTVAIEEYLHASSFRTLVRQVGVKRAREILEDLEVTRMHEVELKDFLIRMSYLGLPGKKQILLDIEGLFETRLAYQAELDAWKHWQGRGM